jgi:transposase
VKRLVAQELTLSFVPDAEQRLWRTVMRRKYQITRSRVQLHNRLESLLAEAHIQCGVRACADLHAVYRRLVKLTLEELRVIEDHLAQLDQQMADLLGHHHDGGRSGRQADST